MAIQDIRAENLRELIKNNRDNLEIIDVRQSEEYQAVHVRGSKLIPMGEIQSRLDEINWDKEVIFICRSGARSKLVASLVANGKEVKNLQYGIYECYSEGKGENLEIDNDIIESYF